MAGKILAFLFLLLALVAGGAMYYLQVYAFYDEVTPTPGRDVLLAPLEGGEARPITYSAFEAIDADSSPIRYRACFSTDLTPDALAQVFALADKAEPRNAPGWFDCFDAEAIGAALAEGRARAFLSQKNVEYGVDRVVAITSDGRGYIWHELNDCGEKAYDGTVIGEECPPHPNAGN